MQESHCILPIKKKKKKSAADALKKVPHFAQHVATSKEGHFLILQLHRPLILHHNLPLIGLLYFLSLREHLVPMQPLFWSRAPHGGLPGDGCWTITRVLDWIPLPQLLSQLDHSDQAESWHSTTAKRIAINELNHLSSRNKELSEIGIPKLHHYWE